MKDLFQEIENIGSEKYKHYGNVFCQISNYDIHNSLTQNKIVDLLQQLVGKMDTLIENTKPQQPTIVENAVEPPKVDPVKKEVVKKRATTTKRKTTENDSK